ncbi:Kanadaptin [Liparis tanakae]|uniref:Kanadaptin n=1 Tax=Liparis tanakae TaxID=230148 RepID=A0A4Z2G9Z6_9TELE|nr:Kanadaptin [Liparis tanakae]
MLNTDVRLSEEQNNNNNNNNNNNSSVCQRLRRHGHISRWDQINMDASPPSDVCVHNMDGSTNPAVKTGARSPAEKDGGHPRGAGQDTDTFKMPAPFAVPPLAARRSGVAAPSRAPAVEAKRVKENQDVEVLDPPREEPSGLTSENGATETDPEDDEDSDGAAAPVKPKRDPQPRVLPARGPPVGNFPPIPYTEPPWGGNAPDVPYALEILKNGTIVDTVPLAHKSYFVVGRLPVCDVALEHPSISRYHATIQYRRQAGEGESVGEERGFYVHDLGSTHGTVVNKKKVPPNTYVRIRVGHVLKFGGSTRLFILQGPEFDEEEESELTVTELIEKTRKQKAELEKRMMGEGSDNDDDDDDDGGEKEEKEKEGERQGSKGQSKLPLDGSGCSWGMDEEAAPEEEDENEENPFSTEFQEDQEAAYLKDPKKALQGFYDREGEELELEFEDQSHGTWLCRIKLPVDDAAGRQLVAEATHTGKKKDTAVQCCLEACRMLEARGLLRQEAVSRKRKQKNWEDEDYYDSDDDTFLDRTGTVERKRTERMKKAGKVDERPDTYESLVAKLSAVESELAESQKKLSGGRGGSSGSSAEDPLDVFMTAVQSEVAMDAVERRKLHVHVASLRKDAQSLRNGSSEAEKPKKSLPLFGAMKGGSKFKLKTGTIGKLPAKRPDLPAELFNMKELVPSGKEDDEEEEEEEAAAAAEENEDDDKDCVITPETDCEESGASASVEMPPPGRQKPARKPARSREPKEPSLKRGGGESLQQDPRLNDVASSPDQSGDGRTHLNDKYGY